jgi:protease-4
MKWMEQVYDAFVAKAAEGRNMTYEALEPKAHGRIYTGLQAKEEGLVDELGGMTVAISEMKSALSLNEEDLISLRIYPRPKTLFETLTSGDLFELRQKLSIIDRIKAEFQQLENPSVWLLAPEIIIR